MRGLAVCSKTSFGHSLYMILTMCSSPVVCFLRFTIFFFEQRVLFHFLFLHHY
uniref:Uncharacterized protein n=1 Tax=Oryza brachyantha TaxID=4533 RepID=J3NCH5_ORYBR